MSHINKKIKFSDLSVFLKVVIVIAIVMEVLFVLGFLTGIIAELVLLGV